MCEMSELDFRSRIKKSDSHSDS